MIFIPAPSAHSVDRKGQSPSLYHQQEVKATDTKPPVRQSFLLAARVVPLSRSALKALQYAPNGRIYSSTKGIRSIRLLQDSLEFLRVYAVPEGLQADATGGCHMFFSFKSGDILISP
ncbi:MAG: hypothetical protein R2825_19770 [Saprospiraceae bacterium]